MTDARSQTQSHRPKVTWRGFLRDETAASAVFLALTISGTVGVVGLGAETGLWFAERRQYQTAADAGAIAGAWSVATQLTAGTAASASLLDATQTGSPWKEAVRNGATDSSDNIAVNYLDSTTTPSRTNPTVQVVVTQPKSSIFASLVMPAGVTIRTVAEAWIVTLGSPCTSAIGSSGQLQISGSITINAPNCILSSNNTMDFNGNASSVNVKELMTAKGITTAGKTLTDLPPVGVGSVPDPFSSLPDSPTVPAGCTSIVAGTTITADATNGTTLCTFPALKGSGKNPPPTPAAGSVDFKDTGSTTVTYTFEGVFFIKDGSFTIDGAKSNVVSTANGATFILAGTNPGIISITSGTINLTAPKNLSGSLATYNGIVFYQDRNAPATTGNSTTDVIHANSTTISGAVYLPKQELDFYGNASTNCTVLVANSVVFKGNSSLDTSGCSSLGLNLPKVYNVSLSQ